MSISKAKILCVDDDPDLLIINSSILRLAGYEVSEATSGNECLRSVKEDRPDLILLDVMLPDIDGIDVCRQIKDDPELVGTYIILISGIKTSTDCRIEGLGVGADGYIVRPVSGQELLARVQAMLRIKAAETALRKSEQQYKMLVETMNEGLGVMNENGMISYVNERLCEMMGLSRDEVIGHRVTEFLHDTDRKIFEEKFQVKRKSISNYFEFSYIRKDGERIYVIVSPKTIFDRDGIYRGSFAVITDITDRKNMEELLREKVERLDLAQNAGKIGIFEWFIPTGRITWSKELEPLYGFSASKFDGKYETWRHTIHPIDRKHAEHEMSRIIKDKEDTDIEFRIVRPDGTIRWMSLRCNIFLDERNEPVRILGINIDITELKQAESEIKKLNEELEQRVNERTKQLQAVIEELEKEIISRKRAEEALRESEEKFRAITFTATDAIILMDEEGKISYWNPAAEEMFGYTKKEAVGKDLHQFLTPPEYRKAYKEAFLIFKNTREGPVIGRTLEFLAIKKDGTKFPVEISKSVISVKGRWEAVGIIRDITARKLDEATLTQYAEQLKMLSNSLIEIHEAERRYLAKDLYEQISYPMISLISYFENILPLRDEDIRMSMMKIQEQIFNLLSKVKDMEFDLYPSMIEEKGLLTTLGWYFGFYSTKTKVRVEFTHDGIEARFSPEKEIAVYRIIQEALDNVARHAGTNKVVVQIEAYKDKIIVNIADIGIGFDPDKTKSQGKAVGLRLMQERAALLGGQLTVDSSSGAGTRIIAKIPL